MTGDKQEYDIATARDLLLLSRLISGQLDVSDLKIDIGEQSTTSG